MAVDADPTEQSLDESTDVEIRSAAGELDDDPALATAFAPEPDMNAETPGGTGPPQRGRSPARMAIAFGLLTVAGLCGLAGWLGYGAQLSHRVTERDAQFLQVGRQGAINLTTIDHTTVDADVARILDSSSGTFRNDFQQRAPAFVAFVKQAQSTTVGNVTAAALESATDDAGRILVAVSVKTSTAAVKDQPLRLWRMRIDVQDDAGTVKVANVEFVP